MRRRVFLGSLAAGVTAAPNDQITLAVVGVGGMGTGHVRNLVKRSDVRVSHLCDIDQAQRERAAAIVQSATGRMPALVEDFRKLLDDQSIHALIIATPHHWHCPIAILAMRAGKDVYVEKPASHVFREGRLLVDAANKYRRIVQHGTQMRSSEVTAQAGEILKSGLLGPIKMARAWNCQRHSHKPPAAGRPAPAGVNYDLWLGPAASREFTPNRFHGSWNWYRDYGNGDIGGDGIHDLDLARWGLGVTTHPVRITAHGSRIDLPPEREFADNMTVSYQYAEDKVLLYEERGWTPYGTFGFDSVNAFYGPEGYMVFSRRGYFQVYLGRKEEKGPGVTGGPRGHPEHLYNFLECVRTRRQPVANAEVAHLSCGLVHLGDIGFRVARVLRFDPDKEQILGDPEAHAMLTKAYRAPFAIPDPV